MLRRLLLPLLGVALFASEAASAQTLPAAPAAMPATSAAMPVAGAYSHPVARPKALTAREKRAAEAAAKAEAAKAVAVVPAQPDASATAGTSWNGWSNEPTAQTTDASYRPATNLSVAPGIPINQIGHGVTTDYNGRPLHHEVSSTSLSTGR